MSPAVLVIAKSNRPGDRSFSNIQLDDLVSDFGSTILSSETSELVLQLESPRLALNLSMELLHAWPGCTVCLGLIDELPLSSRALRLRTVAEALACPAVALVGKISEILGPSISDLTSADLGVHGFHDLLPAERVVTVEHLGAISSLGRINSLSLIDHNLPVMLDSFVGRERELAELLQLVRVHKVVTLTGCGGTGKTRLAIHVAAQMAGEGFSTIRFVGLVDSSPDSELSERIAERLRIRSGSLEDFISGYRAQPTVVVIDNCEHVLRQASACVRQLAGELPLSRIIVTSREPLQIPGEHEFEVAPLAIPAEDEEDWREKWPSYGALRLLNDRLADQGDNLSLRAKDLNCAVSICQKVDGLPLAIEHVAGQAAVLGLEASDRFLSDRLAFLVSSKPNEEPRHRTIRAAIDWSYQLLETKEQSLFQRLSVFPGEFTIGDVLEVCSDEALPEAELPNLTGSLVRKSLVTRVLAQDGSFQFRLLETVREFASTMASGMKCELKRRHFARVSHLIRESFRYSNAEPSEFRFADLRAIYPSIQSALDWGMETRRSEVQELCFMMSRYWMEYGPMADALAMCQRAFEPIDWADSDLNLDHAIVLGVTHWLSGNHLEAETLFNKVCSIAGLRRDHTHRATALTNLGGLSTYRGDYESAAELHREAMDVFVSAGETVRAAKCAANLAFDYSRIGRHNDAVEVLNALLDRDGPAIPAELNLVLHLTLSDSHRFLGNYETACRELIYILGHERAEENLVSSAPAMLRGAILAQNLNRPEISARLLGMANESFRELKGGTLKDREEMITQIGDYLSVACTPEERMLWLSSAAVIPASRRLKSASVLLHQLLVDEL